MQIKYIIHKIGTPKIKRTANGGIAPAGLWWDGTGWGEGENATPIVRLNGSDLPDGGEWVSIYVNEDCE
jgi:hypothetical protein